jgi:hypothetical protein
MQGGLYSPPAALVKGTPYRELAAIMAENTIEPDRLLRPHGRKS